MIKTIKISAESDNEEKLPEENKASSSKDKQSKSLTLVKVTLKCAKNIKSFLLEKDAAHLLTPMKLKEDCVKCQQDHEGKNPFVTYLIVVIKCMDIHVLSS